MGDILAEELENLYLKKGLSCAEIANRLGCSKRTIWLRLSKYGISRRTRAEGLMSFFLKRVKNDLEVNYSEEEKKLLALAIDLEGAVSVAKRRTGRITVYVNMWNTKKVLVDYIRGLAKMGYVSRAKHQGNANEAYGWAISSLFVVQHFLKQIAPYLLAKKKQAELAIRLCELRIKNYSKPLSAEEIQLCQEIQRLNRRGKAN